MIMKRILGTPDRKSHTLFFVFLCICTPNNTDKTVTPRYASMSKKGMPKLILKRGI
jgi:hypothetical protein